jgi:hypothetical protein
LDSIEASKSGTPEWLKLIVQVPVVNFEVQDCW